MLNKALVTHRSLVSLDRLADFLTLFKILNIFTCGHAGHNMVRVVVVVVVVLLLLVGTILKFLSLWPLEGAIFVWQQYFNKMGLIE